MSILHDVTCNWAFQIYIYMFGFWMGLKNVLVNYIFLHVGLFFPPICHPFVAGIFQSLFRQILQKLRQCFVFFFLRTTCFHRIFHQTQCVFNSSFIVNDEWRNKQGEGCRFSLCKTSHPLVSSLPAWDRELEPVCICTFMKQFYFPCCGCFLGQYWSNGWSQ